MTSKALPAFLMLLLTVGMVLLTACWMSFWIFRKVCSPLLTSSTMWLSTNFVMFLKASVTSGSCNHIFISKNLPQLKKSIFFCTHKRSWTLILGYVHAWWIFFDMVHEQWTWSEHEYEWKTNTREINEMILNFVIIFLMFLFLLYKGYEFR